MGSTAGDNLFRPDEERIARFRSALRAIWPEMDEDERSRLGLAVSGGPDSTALLLLAAAALPGRVAAASVDHRLRAGSAREAADVAALCGGLGISHRVLEVEVAPGNLQAEARRVRYAALARWSAAEGLSALATGHHADDQAETLLLRLNRASGVAGLAGTRARGCVPETDIPLLRPLLNWRRGELADLVEQAGIAAARDPSNLDDRFDRARIRKAMATADWLDVAAIAQSAGHLADADAALEWVARCEWDERVRHDERGATYRPKAPRAVALRVIARIVTELDDAPPRGTAVARVFEALSRGQAASIGGLVVRPSAEGWTFATAPERSTRTGTRGAGTQ